MSAPGNHRQMLAGAVWRIMLRDGLEAASVRNVAAEAGMATGSVRHFFKTQAELRVFAIESLVERVGARVARAATNEDLQARVLAMVLELLPVTDETEGELRLWLQFVVRAQTDPLLYDVAQRTLDETHGLLRNIVAGQRELGLIPAETDIDGATRSLQAMIDGLTFDLLVVPHLISRDQAIQAVRHVLLQPEGSSTAATALDQASSPPITSNPESQNQA